MSTGYNKNINSLNRLCGYKSVHYTKFLKLYHESIIVQLLHVHMHTSKHTENWNLTQCGIHISRFLGQNSF